MVEVILFRFIILIIPEHLNAFDFCYSVTGTQAVPNTTPNPSPSDMRRAYDALGITCPVSAGGPGSGLGTGPSQILPDPVIATGLGSGNNPMIRSSAPVGSTPVRCVGPRPPNVNVPLGSDSSQQNAITMQLFGVQHQQHLTNQSNQSGQNSVSNITNQEVQSQQLVSSFNHV